MGNKNVDKYPFGLSRRLYRLNVGMTIVLVAIVATTAAVLWIRAADVSNMKDTMSNQSINGTATHRISFDLSGGNTFASGEVIAIDLASAFSVGGTWTTADFAFDDGTARTIDAVAQGAGTSTVSCTDGANNVGVAIDTTDLVFRVIPCGGSFTPSAVGASVLLTIYGAVPNGWVANPATAGSYSVLITDAGGECDEGDCVIWVAIVDTSDVSVTATVVSAAVCGNGIIEAGEGCDDGNTTSGDGCSATCQVEGGPPPPPPDTTPPVISGIVVTDITTSSASVTWTTNEASTSLVRYGLTSSYGSEQSIGGYVTSHSVPLSSLSEGVTYHYQVCSTDSPGNQACSGDNTFMTLDDTPPVISNVQVTGITGTSATITWDTDESSDSNVDYDTVAGPPYGDTESDATMVTSHSITVIGLTSGTTYHYRVRSGDASSNEAFTADAVFTTADADAPVISNIRVTDVAATSVIVRWDTDEAADSKVDYGLIATYTDIETDATMVIDHAVTLSGLTSSTTYHYRVRSADASSNESASGDLTFTTADTTPPVISNINVVDITTTSARVTWDTDEAADSNVDYGTDATYGDTESDAALVTNHSIDLAGLAPATEIHFRIRTSDVGSNEATSSDQTFTTATPAPPVLSNIRVENITEDQARVLWDTDTSSDSAVDYGTDATYGSTETDVVMTVNHLIVLNGLSTGTTYHYQVRSTDAYSQETVSGDLTFTTSSDTMPPANVTDFTAAPGDGEIVLTWVNPLDADFQGVIILRKESGFPTGPTDGTVVYDGTAETHTDAGLTNGITYFYAAYAYDEVPNYASGALTSAAPAGPPDTTPPGEVTGFTATPGNMEIQLDWTNPADADFAGVRIVRGPAGGTCPTGPTDGTTVYEGVGETWLDVGLTNGTAYCYAAYTFDGVPNWSSGVTSSATPVAPPDVAPPANVTDLTATSGDELISLTWTNPIDLDWAGTVIVRKTGGFPVDQTDGIVVYDGIGNNTIDVGLTNGTMYYYGAFSYDGVPNHASGAFTQEAPVAGAPPPPPPPCADNDGGQNYLVRGTVTTPVVSFIDVCIDRTVLQEYYCTALDYTSEIHDCGLGYKCSAGRCTPDTFVPPTTVCGNGICESRDCDVDCAQMAYDLYIINPDSSEHHRGSGNVRETEIEPGVFELAYEDNSGAFDHDDVVMRLDSKDCRNVTVSLVSHNGTQNHIVRMTTSYEGAPKFDDYIWQDSLVSIGATWNKNCAADPTICVGNENSINCPEDCVEIPPTPEIEEEEPTVTDEERLSIVDLWFFVTRARLPLVIEDVTGEVFPATTVIVYLPDESIRKPIRRAFVNFTGSSYAMQPTQSFEATLGTPSTTGDYPLTMIVEYEDDTNDSIDANIRVVPFGQVIDDSGAGLEGVRVTLYEDKGGGNFGIWDGTPYGMINPQTSREDGKYGFIVPPGTYKLVATLEGYREKETLAFPITNNLAARDMTLIKKPEETIADIAEILVETEDLGEAVAKVADVVAEETIYRAKIVAEDVTEFIQNETVEEQTEQVAAPTVAAVAVANVAVAGATTATAVPYMIYLYSLLTHPSILFLGRRRKKWGVVYDAITKKAVDLAIVRLIDDKTGKIMRSMVTDKSGRYFFIVEPGSYRLMVAKNGFVFPTAYLEGEKEDARFIDLYHGETIHVTQSTSITANVPVDPVA
ncbi:MAG: fibronectin type III domain-containing protein, partial [Patescibacteria group bacterium]|nr:fibronectin type III domain-containing protein [Patescibacteria group bacterium]